MKIFSNVYVYWMKIPAEIFHFNLPVVAFQTRQEIKTMSIKKNRKNLHIGRVHTSNSAWEPKHSRAGAPLGQNVSPAIAARAGAQDAARPLRI